MSDRFSGPGLCFLVESTRGRLQSRIQVSFSLRRLPGHWELTATGGYGKDDR